MTMMMTSSQFGLEDMEDLLWGPSSPMVDAVDLLSVYTDQQELQEGGRASLEWDTPPVSPINSLSPPSSSSPPFYSPPPSPPAVLFHEDKVGTESDLLPLSSVGHLGPLKVALDDGKEEMLSDLDWMAERVEFDLESLIGSRSTTDEAPSSPDDLLASLDCPMELDSLSLPSPSTPMPTCPPSASSPNIHTLTPTLPAPTSEPSVITVEDPESYIEDQVVLSPPPCVPEPQEELEIRSEPASPDPSPPVLDSPSSPACTLDLGSEVDVSECEVGPVVSSAVPSVQRVVLSLSPTRLVFVLAPKKEVTLSAPAVTSPAEVIRVCAPQKPCRSRPYPEPTACPPSPSGSGVKVRKTAKSKGKKQKKMEQNKTAATRYRQKKKLEKEDLLEEYTILERKNVELKEKAESMAREIKYLKELMEEVRQTVIKKGLAADP
ncbi:activating transcription factor 4b [Takifugu rubripes]|uniref:Cyclic AMP-dependent transcription factor ATF-4 n=1 Tax=Takifugu rubripes TaxID=31033 RepID=A0A3B5K044_TAKRU|nr:cyclic AMP-dependent transcription factor ATF-4-like [Takifugu rubripes]|eukprot:XP_003964479.1 PREDICTED: cyclic AMP-dependent transcription factor ATF-4-like [Takifugu rubripes]